MDNTSLFSKKLAKYCQRQVSALGYVKVKPSDWVKPVNSDVVALCTIFMAKDNGRRQVELQFGVSSNRLMKCSKLEHLIPVRDYVDYITWRGQDLLDSDEETEFFPPYEESHLERMKQLCEKIIQIGDCRATNILSAEDILNYCREFPRFTRLSYLMVDYLTGRLSGEIGDVTFFKWREGR